ncbi:MAG: CxxxxCH/CxxCH domain-containing protein, partial [Verrucomicrobia bacterium]|nr:CxxxxCH/CxxCH domain-containing protein [Deltaproteobacteria bacterium]
VYCHSNGKGTYANPLPVWGGAAMNCGSCHINQTSTFSGSHEKHSKSSALGGYGIDCLICHYGSGSGSALHVDGSTNVVFNTAIVGPSATWDNAAKKCFSILCHDTNASAGPTWNVPATGQYGGTYKPTCIGCHSGEVGTRAAVVPQFAGQSHHIQGIAMSNSYCYPCHMEAADVAGTVNVTYHDRSANKPVELVIWGAGARGAAFTRYSAGSITPARKRLEYAKIDNHCLGCHNAANAASTPFGDGKTPKAYAWDGTSVAERYSIATTTLWGKVTGNGTAVKNNAASNTKAYSAHGRADLNTRGWAVGNATTGETYAANTSGAVKVLCFDCHNSHGTSATGIMSSYSSATGRYQGGILKSTVNGIGGYTADYTPLTGGDAAAPNKNAYNPGAAICFDCHNTASASATVPWGYTGTFGSSKAIYGYHDKPYFGNYSSFASTVTFPYKKTRADNKGGHFGAYSSLSTTPTKQIRGLCTPCHDPHGVSPVTPANQPYMVPLLKGTWVTSPYKQDVAPSAINEVRGGGKNLAVKNVGSTPAYFIDQNSMQAAVTGYPASAKSWTFATNASTTLQSTTVTQFAGLCTGCHDPTALKNTAAASSANWKSMKRIHNSVKGWATTGGGNAGNAVHAFTCSKCHTAHNSRLPRLLVTNCLDVKHRGRVASTGSMPTVNRGTNSSGSGAGRFPQGGGGVNPGGTGGAGERALNPGAWFFGKTNGTAVTTNTITLNSQTKCHQTATSGGAPPGDGTPYSSGAAQQRWNNVSPW